MEKYCIIFDIDGTLANIDHRLIYVQSKPYNWKAFEAGIPLDTLRQDVYNMYVNASVGLTHEKYQDTEARIILVSGRSEDSRIVTEDWLVRNNITDYKHLLMRKSGDYRADTIIKKEILDQLHESGWEVIYAVDDRPSVIRMWRENGIRVIDVGSGKEF